LFSNANFKRPTRLIRSSRLPPPSSVSFFTAGFFAALLFSSRASHAFRFDSVPRFNLVDRWSALRTECDPRPVLLPAPAVSPPVSDASMTSLSLVKSSLASLLPVFDPWNWRQGRRKRNAPVRFPFFHERFFFMQIFSFPPAPPLRERHNMIFFMAISPPTWNIRLAVALERIPDRRASEVPLLFFSPAFSGCYFSLLLFGEPDPLLILFSLRWVFLCAFSAGARRRARPQRAG